MPGFQLEAPEGDRVRIADEQARVAADVLGRLAVLEVGATVVERVGPGLWRVVVRGTNTGYFPTSLAIGEKARRLTPIVVSVGLPVERIASGEVRQRWGRIDGSGAFAESEWLLLAPDGSAVEFEVRSALLGDRRLSVTLEEAAQ